MSDKPKKPSQPSEADLIRSALNTNLDDSSVDIFSQDLFGEPNPASAPEPAPAPAAQAEPSPKPEEVEEIQMPEPPAGKRPAVPAELSWEKPPAPAAPAAPSKPASPDRDFEMKLEVGQMASVKAVKESDQLDQTGEILMQLEKMGDDFLSAEEMKKLFQNVNRMIDLINRSMSRLDRLEQKLKAKGIL